MAVSICVQALIPEGFLGSKTFRWPAYKGRADSSVPAPPQKNKMRLGGVFIVFFHLLVALSVCTASSERGSDPDYRRCEMNLRTWARGALRDLAEVGEEDDGKLKHLFFFLHVPRTGGRNLHSCLFQSLFPPELQCKPSYTKLHYSSSQKCRLLVSHDDYSTLTKLPKQMTSVMTTMRHPVDRVFSVYEFSIEVAARFFRKNSPRALLVSPKILTQSGKGINTLGIWPWSYLVPWMQQDLISRRTKKQAGTTTPLVTVDPYDVPSVAMPLHEFIHQPIVVDLVHNGATFQVAGLTNRSYLSEAGDLRNCVVKYPDLGHYILDVAKERLNRMLYVGLTERQKDTASLFAHVIAEQVFAQSPSMNTSSVLHTPAVYIQDAKNLEGQSLVKLSEEKTVGIDALTKQSKEHWRKILSMPQNISTIYDLVSQYNTCAKKRLEIQVSRHHASMKYIPPVKFSKEARKQVADAILAEILQFNSLDVELHRHAQSLFFEQEVYNQSTPQEWIQRRRQTQRLNNGRMKDSRFVDQFVHERISLPYSGWLGLRRMCFLMSLSTVVIFATVGGLCWGAIFGRIMKIRSGLCCRLHQKI